MRKVVDRKSAVCAILLALLWLTCAPAVAQETGDDPVAHARQLAYSGKEHRDEALAILKKHLENEADDTDARVFYGIVLSWQGRYDEAREQLKQVLANNPTHADALPALINVEFWSGHPENAEQLAREALAGKPDDVPLLLLQARALRKMNREREARAVLDHVLILDGKNQNARQMRREITTSTLTREFLISHTYDWFSDGRSGQHETTVSLKESTPYGSLIGRINRADRFSTTDYQGELDFYPHFRSGTYGYFNVGYAPRGALYPSYRVGADLYQSIGHGLEISGGYRRLEFTSGVDIYTFSLAKYFHNWLFTGRGFVVPGDPGTSGTALFSARYFLGSEGLHDYLEFRYSHGASPALAQTTQDIEVLADSRYGLVLDKALGARWVGTVSGNIGESQRLGLSHLLQYEVQVGLYFRF
ncbi:MAG TPA: YaiO family outer membrane beta-barrel protein [Candidatus Angelobacter sp.]